MGDDEIQDSAEQELARAAISRLEQSLRSGFFEADQMSTTPGPVDANGDPCATAMVLLPSKFERKWFMLVEGVDPAKLYAFLREYGQFATGLKITKSGVGDVAHNAGNVVIRQPYEDRELSDQTRAAQFASMEQVIGPAVPPGAKRAPSHLPSDGQVQSLRKFIDAKATPDPEAKRIYGPDLIDFVDNYLREEDMEPHVFGRDVVSSKKFYAALRSIFRENLWHYADVDNRPSSTFVVGISVAGLNSGRGKSLATTEPSLKSIPGRVIHVLRSRPFGSHMNEFEMRLALDDAFPGFAPHNVGSVRTECSKLRRGGVLGNTHGRGYFLERDYYGETQERG